jgi:hypothetical protein
VERDPLFTRGWLSMPGGAHGEPKGRLRELASAQDCDVGDAEGSCTVCKGLVIGREPREPGDLNQGLEVRGAPGCGVRWGGGSGPLRVNRE